MSMANGRFALSVNPPLCMNRARTWRVVGFTFALSAIAGLAASTMPAWRFTRTQAAGALGDAARGSSRRTSRTRTVLVAAEPDSDAGILGVVAIGLAEGEDLRINGAEDETDEGTAGPERRHWPYDNYEQLARIPRACAVIQATHDNYFPAADARQRFGADGTARRFYAIDAENHRFSGGKVEFRGALAEAIGWIAATQSRLNAVTQSTLK